MKLNHKIEINLLDFVKSGKFDYITLGKSKEWVINNFVDPDFKHNDNKSLSVWGFGDFEIYFTNKEVSMIFTDQIETLLSGSKIEMDKSIFGNYEKCTLSNIQTEFNEMEVDYEIKHLKKLEQVILKVSKSNVELGFCFHEENQKKQNYKLFFIALESSPYYKV